MEIFSFIFVMLMIWGFMWLFFKFMYPKPPRAFMPQEGDIITPRDCDYCGYPLAEYRGILETKPTVLQDKPLQDNLEQVDNEKQIDNDFKYSNSDNNTAKATHRQASVDIKLADDGRKLTKRERKQQALKLQQQQKLEDEKKRAEKIATTWFFCNAEHQAKFHAGETYNKP